MKRQVNLLVWHGSMIGQLNFGDTLNYYIIKELFNGVGIKNDYYPLAMIGSTINQVNQNTIITGAGLISNKKKYLPKVALKYIQGVRGNLTKNLMEKTGYSIKYGAINDPAVLLVDILSNKKFRTPSKPRNDIAIIPHYIDYPLIKNYMNNHNGRIYSHLKFIDVNNSLENIVMELASCKYVVSSSLHGIILADCLQIPSIWAFFSDYDVGHGFKFYDYFSISKRKNNQQIHIEFDLLSFRQIEKICNKNAQVSNIPSNAQSIKEIIEESIEIQNKLSIGIG